MKGTLQKCNQRPERGIQSKTEALKQASRLINEVPGQKRKDPSWSFPSSIHLSLLSIIN